MKIKLQEVPKSYSNKTDINKTEYSDTDSSYTDYNETVLSNPILSGNRMAAAEKNVIGEMEAYREIIREHIEYQAHNGEEVDELVERIVEVMMMPDDASIKIAGVDKPAAFVKNRFMKLSYSHIEYVLFCLQKNTTKVGNIKSYLLTTLYNATMTINNYYHAEVNHDMYGGG